MALNSIVALVFLRFPDAVGKCPLKSMFLADVINRPDILVEGDNYDSMLRAFTSQASSQMDRFSTYQVRHSVANYLRIYLC